MFFDFSLSYAIKYRLLGFFFFSCSSRRARRQQRQLGYDMRPVATAKPMFSCGSRLPSLVSL